MMHQKCERSVITFSSLISACEKAGNWRLAVRFFEQMHDERCLPNTVTFNSLITACAQGVPRSPAHQYLQTASGELDSISRLYHHAQRTHHGLRAWRASVRSAHQHNQPTSGIRFMVSGFVPRHHIARTQDCFAAHCGPAALR